jgi:hypothetical protein
MCECKEKVKVCGGRRKGREGDGMEGGEVNRGGGKRSDLMSDESYGGKINGR